jgi:hypothetical protein
MITASATKPEYLELLNRISVGERRAEVYLKAWADVTSDPALRAALTFVAGRETSHGEVFCQLISRLGFSVHETDDPKFVEQQRIYGDPNVSDAEKVRYGRAGRENGAIERAFAAIDDKVYDERVDALTRDTLRWYVHEERDSGEVLRPVYARVTAAAGDSNGHAPAPSVDATAIMTCMTAGFASLQQTLKELAEGLVRQPKAR